MFLTREKEVTKGGSGVSETRYLWQKKPPQDMWFSHLILNFEWWIVFPGISDDFSFILIMITNFEHIINLALKINSHVIKNVIFTSNLLFLQVFTKYLRPIYEIK